MTFSSTFLQYGRGLEWLTSAIMLGLAVTLWLPGDTLGASRSYAAFLMVGINETMLVAPLIAISVARMIGLYINGNWRRSPIVRMVGAVFGSGLYCALAFMFTIPWVVGQQEALSTGPLTYFLLMFADLLAAYRSAADVGNCKHH